MEIASNPKYRRQIRIARDLLGPVEYKVLVPNFPPFARVQNKEASGPLVDLHKRFAALVNKSPVFVPIEYWDYERQITSGAAISIAAPIYVRPGQPLSIYCFCELETCHCVVSLGRKTADFRRRLGRVHSVVGDINALNFQFTEEPGKRGYASQYKRHIHKLCQSVTELLKTCPAESFAIPEEYDEVRVVSDFGFPAPEVIPCRATDDVVERIRKYANDGYIVLCNSVVSAQLLENNPTNQYFSAPLLKSGIPTWAGIAFSEQDQEIGELFEGFLRYEDPVVEELLAACESHGSRLLPLEQRGRQKFEPTASIAWSLRLSRSDDYSDVILGAMAQGAGAISRQTILEGTVVSIDSLDPRAYAEVTLRDGEAKEMRWMEVDRLAKAHLAYHGAKFRYIITDIGSSRIVKIEPNEAANAQLRNEVESLLTDYLQDNANDKARTP